MARSLIPMAILYDFDGTLSPINMQEHDFIPKLGFRSPSAFWAKVKKLAKDQDCCEILAYLHLMLKEAERAEIPVSKQIISDYGKGIELFAGVKDWFDRVNSTARSHGVRLKHYVISSGVKPLIEGTSIAKHFERIYACDFIYDADGKPIAPGVAIDYTSKTQYIFRINKGTLDQFDNGMINRFVPMDERPIPLANFIYIGDGTTDVPAMKMTAHYGGLSIAVYDSNRRGKKQEALNFLDQGRAGCVARADYREGKRLEKIVVSRIEQVASRHRAERLFAKRI